MSDGQYFIVRDGQNREGPMAIDQLRQMAAGGQLRPEHLVWTAGMPEWKAASTLPGMFPSAVAPVMGGDVPMGPGGMGGFAGMPQEPMAFGYAGFWIRFVAFFIDSIIMWVAQMIIQVPLYAIGGVTGGFGGSSSAQSGAAVGIMLLAWVLSIVVNWLYYAIMESSTKQATLGKMAMGIKVTTLEGQRINFGRATGRYFGKIISGIILLIGYIMAAFTERKQALHDMMAGTLVVKARQ
jgi:uncharacterized RDD family membrane protein YckC